MNFIYSQFFTSKIFISGGFSSVLILAYNHMYQKFYCRHHDLTDRYDVSISQMRVNIFQ